MILCSATMTFKNLLDMGLIDSNPILEAKASIGQGNLINAIVTLTKAIALNPDYSDAYLLRSQTLLRMGDRKSAREDMEKLISTYPQNEDVLMLKARIEIGRAHV